MSSIDIKELDRIQNVLDREGWKLDRKTKRVLWVYPPDGESAPFKIMTSNTKTATNAYVKLRQWGLDLEPSRGTGKSKKGKGDLAVSPPIVPAQMPAEAAQWRLSAHTQERAEERRIEPAEILTAVVKPDSVHPAANGKQIHIAGDVKVVLDPRTKTVVTTVDINNSRANRVSQSAPAPAPAVPDTPVRRPEPQPQPDKVLGVHVSEHDVRNMAARVRATSNRGGKRFFGTWEPPKAATRQSELPLVWLTPAWAAWLAEVVIRSLQDRPGRWASILNLPDPSTAKQLSKIIENRVPEMEIAVRDVSIWACWNGARV